MLHFQDSQAIAREIILVTCVLPIMQTTLGILIILTLHMKGVAACSLLSANQKQSAVVSPARSACFVVIVHRGEAVQLSIEQPVDMELQVRGAPESFVADAFEFGRETATIDISDRYQVEVRLKEDAPPTSFFMSRTTVPLQAARNWRKAENQSTRAKRSGKLEDIRESIRIWQDIDDQSAIGRTYLQQGFALFVLEDSAAARESFEQARSICRAIPDVRCTAEAASNCGITAGRLGQFESAVERLNEAVDAFRQLSPRLHGRALSNLGLLYRQTGDFQQALSIYNRALTILPRRDRLSYAILLNNIGVCHSSLAESELARSFFERALAETTLRGAARNSVRLNLGREYMLSRDLARAQSILERAAKEADKLHQRVVRAGALNNLGQALWRRQEYEQAKLYLDQALASDQALGDKRGRASDLHYLGLIAREQHQYDQSREFLTEALTIRQECGLRDDAVDSLSALAELDFATGQAAEAREITAKAMTLLESVRAQVPGPALRASYYARRRGVVDLTVALAMAPGGQQSTNGGLLAVERGRGRALLDLLAEGSVVRGVSTDLLKRRADLRRQLNLLSLRLAGRSQEQSVDLRTRVQELMAEDAQVEASIRQSVSDRRLAQPLDSVERIQRELPRDSALLEYHLGERQSYLWLVRPDSVTAFPLAARAVIEKQVERLVTLFGEIKTRRQDPRKEAAFNKAIRNLSQTLLSPLSGTEIPLRLILVPDGVLHRVPFAALWLRRARQQLGLTHELIQIPSASYLLTGKKPRPAAEFPKSILAIADPVFSRDDPRVQAQTSGAPNSAPTVNLPRLPFTADIDTITQQVPAGRRSILRGFDANSDQLQKLLRQNQFGILHLSTHATIDDQIPDLSRVALSLTNRAGRPVDGFLHPYQLAELPLNGSIVVLSACDTALGKVVMGEGLAGFSSSLFQAGVSQLLLTITKVDAEASADFFSEVYKRTLTTKPARMESAMTAARQSLAKSARWSDPYYWSAFIAVGQPTEAH